MGQVFRRAIIAALLVCGCADAKQRHAPDAGDSGSGGDAGDAGAGGGGGSGATSGDGGSGGVSVEAYLNAISDVFYRQWVECPQAFESLLRARATLRTPERWRALQTQMLARADPYAAIHAAIDAGRLVYDAELATTCLELLQDLPCEWLPGRGATDSPCVAVLRGTVALGDTCFDHNECANDAYCQADGQACSGVCASKQAPGTPCEDSDACSVSSGYTACEFSDEDQSERCMTHPVQRGATLDEACGKLADGTFVMCSAGLWCDGERFDAGHCRAPIAIGQPCQLHWICEELGVCDHATNTCQPMTVQTEVGAPCSIDDGSLQLCDPLANLVCRNERCAAAAPGVLDGPCWRSDLSGFSCQAGLYCDVTEDRCHPLKPAGAACLVDRECEISCNELEGVCTDQPCIL